MELPKPYSHSPTGLHCRWGLGTQKGFWLILCLWGSEIWPFETQSRNTGGTSTAHDTWKWDCEHWAMCPVPWDSQLLCLTSEGSATITFILRITEKSEAAVHVNHLTHESNQKTLCFTAKHYNRVRAGDRCTHSVIRSVIAIKFITLTEGIARTVQLQQTSLS